MTAWKASKNRGFYYGEAGGTPWTNDLMWKVSVPSHAYDARASHFF